MSDSTLSQLKNIPERDRKQIEQAEEMLGREPESMGFMKNLFWGRVREEMVFPYPETDSQETSRCDELLVELDAYLRDEHPHFEIDQKQKIPKWAIDRLFSLGVMGMIIPPEFGGGGFSVTSYNRALQRIGAACGSTAVLVSAHQSIGCGALKLYGTHEQKERYLRRMATDTLSAFCLSEPNVGCDAGGQETRCEVSGDGEYYILNGEKKWATSGALAGFFTVTAKQKMLDPKTGEQKDRVTALICTPDMEGIDIYSRNRAKCGIRGTWQARIRFNNVRVPRGNLLHKEGQGLNVALTCLNYGRSTLSSGMVGAAEAAFEQAGKWARYRHQFQRALDEFDLVQERLAKMAAYCYALDAVLYMTTGIVDRGDEDIMVETAACKVFCSEMGFRTVDHAMQIMGGEGYMTENIVERLWRDSRINTIVEGANEVMHSFVFAYGSKQLGEHMLGIKASPFGNLSDSVGLAAQLFLGVKPEGPEIRNINGKLEPLRKTLETRVRDFSHLVKVAFKDHGENLITEQTLQYRISMCAIWLYAMTCSLSKLNLSMNKGAEEQQLQDEIAIVEYVFALGQEESDQCIRGLKSNSDTSMRTAAIVARRMIDRLPNDQFSIPEKTPDAEALGKGRSPNETDIPQFGNGSLYAQWQGKDSSSG